IWSEDSVIADAVQDAQTVLRGGVGFGDAMSNREVERAAIAYVKEILGNEGWGVTSVESKRIGFDLLCKKKKDERHVEVKGVRGPIPVFVITEGELRRAECDPYFWLYVVTDALDSPNAHIMSGEEVIERYAFVALAYRAVIRGTDERT